MSRNKGSEDKGTARKSSRIGMARVGTSVVLTPKESLTFKNCEDLENIYKELISKKNTNILLDCKSLSFLDSKALELLLQMQEELEQRDGSLKMLGMNSVCRDILLVTRLINIFHLHQDIQEALKRES